MANNIVILPVENSRLNTFSPRTIEEIQDSIENVRASHVQAIVEEIMPKLVHMIVMAGFDVFQDDEKATLMKDQALISESIRSLMLRTYEMPHPLQIVSSRSFYFDDEDDLLLDPKALIVTVGNSNDDDHGPSTGDDCEFDGPDWESYKLPDRRINDSSHDIEQHSSNSSCE